MRLRNKDLQTVFLKKHDIKLDDESNEIVSYSDEFEELKMNVQSAGGTLNAQLYGSKLPYMISCKYQGTLIGEGQNELDGLCVNVDSSDKPDYRIMAISVFSTHINIMIERL
ncbi:hypothetical protein [Dellaglioa algida]|uniref:Uncharacterized protein n=1 Tax=Dellaglioa algida TaxID=105612 RepID=A0A5C6M7U9_9LACO|nr:hypothetical protein [Dellaglioa algida]MDK1720223.1 hypothetical protein [Dellaglioa algida]MDK1723613.1 hypothetical protein [Dellaglioa algida]TWW10249.1 hypothetical protein LABALGLTS371_15370 [Dellaglioa algida]